MTDKINKGNIAVLGAGIIGINCAISLQERGYQVTLIDKQAPGEGCSKGNAGHFATEQVFPLAEFSVLWQLPKMLLDPLGPVAISPKYMPKALPWFVRFIGNMFASKRTKNTKILRELNEKALDCYRTLLPKANAEHLFVNKGSLLVFEGTPINEVKKQLQHYQSQGVAVQLLDKSQLSVLEPNLSNNIQYGLFFTEVAHTVEPLQLSQTLADYAISLGVEILQQNISSIQPHANNVEITTNSDNLNFDQVIVATGAWSEQLLKPLGYKLPIEAERGYSLDLPNSTINQLNRPVASAERRFIMTPMAHGLRLAGTVEFAGLNQKANMNRATMLLENAQHIVNKTPNKAELNHEGWLGFRPSMPDSLPVMGRAPYHSNVILALGHQHLGLTLGAITGKLIGQLIDNEAIDIDLTPLCLSRFQ